MKRRRFVGFFVALVAISSLCSCISGKRVMPPVEERGGRLYCYTRDFFKYGSSSQICFFRQPYEVLDGLMPWSSGMGHPGDILLGVAVCVPLALADWLVASPVVDTVLLPYDIQCKFRSKEETEPPQVPPP